MNPRRIKDAFFRRLGNYRPFQQLLDLLPDVAFFVKNRKSQFMMNNTRAVECCGAASEDETVGKIGYEYFSDDRMALYLEQDRQVMKTGKPIINAICPAPQKGANALIIYSKVPLRDRRGRIIGLAGIYREIRDLESPEAKLGQIGRAIRTIHERYAEPLAIRELANQTGLSTSQFNRQFRSMLGTTPREYLLRVRAHAACRLLVETNDKATVIALKTGFYDHSHFSRTFRRVMGVSPQIFRRRHASQRLFGQRTARS